MISKKEVRTPAGQKLINDLMLEDESSFQAGAAYEDDGFSGSEPSASALRLRSRANVSGPLRPTRSTQRLGPGFHSTRSIASALPGDHCPHLSPGELSPNRPATAPEPATHLLTLPPQLPSARNPRDSRVSPVTPLLERLLTSKHANAYLGAVTAVLHQVISPATTGAPRDTQKHPGAVPRDVYMHSAITPPSRSASKQLWVTRTTSSSADLTAPTPDSIAELSSTSRGGEGSRMSPSRMYSQYSFAAKSSVHSGAGGDGSGGEEGDEATSESALPPAVRGPSAASAIAAAAAVAELHQQQQLAATFGGSGAIPGTANNGGHVPYLDRAYGSHAPLASAMDAIARRAEAHKALTRQRLLQKQLDQQQQKQQQQKQRNSGGGGHQVGVSGTSSRRDGSPSPFPSPSSPSHRHQLVLVHPHAHEPYQLKMEGGATPVALGLAWDASPGVVAAAAAAAAAAVATVAARAEGLTGASYASVGYGAIVDGSSDPASGEPSLYEPSGSGDLRRQSGLYGSNSAGAGMYSQGWSTNPSGTPEAPVSPTTRNARVLGAPRSAAEAAVLAAEAYAAVRSHLPPAVRRGYGGQLAPQTVQDWETITEPNRRMMQAIDNVTNLVRSTPTHGAPRVASRGHVAASLDASSSRFPHALRSRAGASGSLGVLGGGEGGEPSVLSAASSSTSAPFGQHTNARARRRYIRYSLDIFPELGLPAVTARAGGGAGAGSAGAPVAADGSGASVGMQLPAATGVYGSGGVVGSIGSMGSVGSMGAASGGGGGSGSGGLLVGQAPVGSPWSIQLESGLEYDAAMELEGGLVVAGALEEQQSREFVGLRGEESSSGPPGSGRAGGSGRYVPMHYTAAAAAAAAAVRTGSSGGAGMRYIPAAAARVPVPVHLHPLPTPSAAMAAVVAGGGPAAAAAAALPQWVDKLAPPTSTSPEPSAALPEVLSSGSAGAPGLSSSAGSLRVGSPSGVRSGAASRAASVRVGTPTRMQTAEAGPIATPGSGTGTDDGDVPLSEPRREFHTEHTFHHHHHHYQQPRHHDAVEQPFGTAMFASASAAAAAAAGAVGVAGGEAHPAGPLAAHLSEGSTNLHPESSARASFVVSASLAPSPEPSPEPSLLLPSSARPSGAGSLDADVASARVSLAHSLDLNPRAHDGGMNLDLDSGLAGMRTPTISQIGAPLLLGGGAGGLGTPRMRPPQTIAGGTLASEATVPALAASRLSHSSNAMPAFVSPPTDSPRGEHEQREEEQKEEQEEEQADSGVPYEQPDATDQVSGCVASKAESQSAAAAPGPPTRADFAMAAPLTTAAVEGAQAGQERAASRASYAGQHLRAASMHRSDSSAAAAAAAIAAGADAEGEIDAFTAVGDTATDAADRTAEDAIAEREPADSGGLPHMSGAASDYETGYEVGPDGDVSGSEGDVSGGEGLRPQLREQARGVTLPRLAPAMAPQGPVLTPGTGYRVVTSVAAARVSEDPREAARLAQQRELEEQLQRGAEHQQKVKAASRATKALARANQQPSLPPLTQHPGGFTGGAPATPLGYSIVQPQRSNPSLRPFGDDGSAGAAGAGGHSVVLAAQVPDAAEMEMMTSAARALLAAPTAAAARNQQAAARRDLSPPAPGQHPQGPAAAAAAGGRHPSSQMGDGHAPPGERRPSSPTRPGGYMHVQAALEGGRKAQVQDMWVS